MAINIDGVKVSTELLDEMKLQISTLQKKPNLAVILVGEDKASEVYVANKQKKCDYVGMTSTTHRMSSDVSENKLLDLIKNLNEDNDVTGILVQLPLPAHINIQTVLNSISTDKDVDCFNPANVGLLSQYGSKSKYVPCTPMGIVKLLEYYSIDMRGKHCVIIGRSNIVGKPLMHLMLEQNATVTVCHSNTENLATYTKSADILISAVGKVNTITRDMVKQGAVVIDVGINRDTEGKLVGDVDFKNVLEVASYITPVPGGVGPMTIAMLLRNCLSSVQDC